MAFLQLKSNDQTYYDLVKNNKIDRLKELLGNPEWLKDINTIIPFPGKETLIKHIYEPNVAFLSSSLIDNSGLLIVKNLPNSCEDGTKTKQQELFNEDINSDLYNRFGMFVSNPSVTFRDLGGFEEPKRDMLKTKEYIEKGLIQKNLSIFLGVSRSGKSFLAECLAGELKYKLILLDLGVIMCDTNPSKKLDDFFYYLETIDNYVLLIDEIEKVADPNGSAAMSRVLIGKLLTIFNNFNSESGFNIKSNFVIATANNITALLEKNPEFINRFGLKYFVNYPEKDNFIDVCDYYIKKMKITGITGIDVYNYSSALYSKNEIPRINNDENKKFGKYASGEVKEFMGNLLLYCENDNGLLRCDIDTLNKVLNLQKPQIQFANKGVLTTIEAAKIANFKEVN